MSKNKSRKVRSEIFDISNGKSYRFIWNRPSYILIVGSGLGRL